MTEEITKNVVGGECSRIQILQTPPIAMVNYSERDSELIIVYSCKVHRCFFHKFNEHFVRKFYSTYVSAPTTLKEVAKIYDKIGLPGCVGSIDCVHIAWERCPQIHKNWYNGKEGKKQIATKSPLFFISNI